MGADQIGKAGSAFAAPAAAPAAASGGLGSLLGPLGAIASIAGTGLEAYGKYQAGRAENDMSRYNARLLDLKARGAEMAMESETGLAHERARELKATQRARYGTSGAEVSSGTPLLVLAEQAGKMERDIMSARRTRMIEAQQYRDAARMKRWEGKQAKRSGVMGAVGTVLGGAGGLGLAFM